MSRASSSTPSYSSPTRRSSALSTCGTGSRGAPCTSIAPMRARAPGRMVNTIDTFDGSRLVAGTHRDLGLRIAAIAIERLERRHRLRRPRERRRRAVPLDDDAPQIAFGQAQRSLEHDAPDALRGKEVVGQHDAVASQRGVDLHVLIQAEAEEVRHALAHLDHRERRAGARLDDLDELGVLQRGALQLQPHFDDRLADVIGDGGFEQARRQEQQSEQYDARLVSAFRRTVTPLQNSFLTRMSSA